jgi:ubiquinol-cytochrome c reductase iron-sulfur subunit
VSELDTTSGQIDGGFSAGDGADGADGAHGDGAHGAGAHGAGGAVPVASFDDPHLKPYARNPRRTEMIIGICLALGFLGFAAYGGLYFVGGQPQLEGVFAGVGFFAFGFGMSAWGKYLLPQGPFVEQRHVLSSNEPERDSMTAALVQRTELTFRRRGFLGGLLAAAGGVMGVVLAFPLIRSLSPNQPGKTLDVTNWTARTRLVDISGKPVHVDALEVGGALTVFPEGFDSTAIEQMANQTMLLRPGPVTANVTTMPGRETWGPRGYVAYSKVCTHAGCPVGLYQELDEVLLCPCHQSMFNILNGAVPFFGPAPRPLPQLPLMVDSEGFLRAQAAYDQPIGPGFWERTTT